MNIRFTAAIFVLWACWTSMVFAGEDVEPEEIWSGKVVDESLRDIAPRSGVIDDFETFEKVWTAWRPQEKLPKIDFESHVILVGTVSGPNAVKMRPTFVKRGSVEFAVGGAKIGGRGFGYKLMRIVRHGIITINGSALTGINRSQDDSILVTVTGTLRTGIRAAGGETTGVDVTSKSVTWELFFPKSGDLERAAEKLDGKKVVVQGSLERHKGIVRKDRWIVIVSGLKGL